MPIINQLKNKSVIPQTVFILPNNCIKGKAASGLVFSLYISVLCLFSFSVIKGADKYYHLNFYVMYWLKKLRQALSGKKAEKEQTRPEQENSDIRMLIALSHPIVHPSDLVEGLGIAIAYHTLGSAMLSLDQIRLYNLYSLEDNSFLGSFYGIKQNDLYYGNIVGMTEIFSCPKYAFRFEETDKLSVPLKHDKGSLYVLMCRYDRKTAGLTVSHLKRTDQNDGSETLLYKFNNKVSFGEAFDYCQSIIY